VRWAVVAVLCTSSVALAQGKKGKPCDGNHLELKTGLAAGKLPYFYSDKTSDLLNHQCGGENETLRRWSSSFLKPSRREPKYRVWPDGEDGADGDGTLHDTVDYLSWCGEYSAFSTGDGKPTTAWCEGAASDGAGELMVSPFIDPARPVEIQAGFAKSLAKFKENGRPQKVRVHVIEELLNDRYPCPDHWAAETARGRRAVDDAWKPLYQAGAKVIASAEHTLKDTAEFQPLAVPKFEAKKDHAYFLAIEILSVVPGSKYKDACISELRNGSK
jgi:hypothetical protein